MFRVLQASLPMASHHMEHRLNPLTVTPLQEHHLLKLNPFKLLK